MTELRTDQIQYSPTCSLSIYLSLYLSIGPDMTLDVYRGRKTTNQQQQNPLVQSGAIIRYQGIAWFEQIKLQTTLLFDG